MTDMEKEQHIARLLERFMDGLTTIEEEDMLARYFRSHDVPAEWVPYKQMFAYFDQGMPAGQPAVLSGRGHRVRHVAVALLGVAAAVVAILLLVPRSPSADGPVQTAAVEWADVAVTDTCMQPQADADTASRVNRPVAPRHRERVRRLRDVPPPPPVYLAEAEAGDTLVHDVERQTLEALHAMAAEQQKAFEELERKTQCCELAISLMLQACMEEDGLADDEPY